LLLFFIIIKLLILPEKNFQVVKINYSAKFNYNDHCFEANFSLT
jgi:hypothetical protein